MIRNAAYRRQLRGPSAWRGGLAARPARLIARVGLLALLAAVMGLLEALP